MTFIHGMSAVFDAGKNESNFFLSRAYMVEISIKWLCIQVVVFVHGDLTAFDRV